MARNAKVEAVAYLRTSSAANVGSDKDSDKRQRAAIEAFAKANGYVVVGEFYDAAVSGKDPVDTRPGFAAMLDRISGNGVRTIIVESPDRFARDLTVQITGHDYLKTLGVTLVPTTAPDFFMEDTPTAELVRQVLGAVAQFEKATLVAKLRAARERKRKETGRCEGRKPNANRGEVAARARELFRKPVRKERRSLREVAAELAAAGYVTSTGKPYSAEAVKRLLEVAA